MENERQCVIPLHKPSQRELAFFFVSGILVSFPFALFFSQSYSLFPLAFSLVILAPFVEELAKVFPLFYRHGETEKAYVTIGILIGLGFGISEFFLYILFLGAPIFPRIPAIIFHGSSAAITSFGIAKKNPWPYYLVAVALHLTNNFFALNNTVTIGSFVALIVLITTYLLAWQLYKKASKEKIVV